MSSMGQLILRSAMRASRSVSQAWGSTPLCFGVSIVVSVLQSVSAMDRDGNGCELRNFKGESRMRQGQRKELTTLAYALVVIALPLTESSAAEPELPRLILQITVDQLLGDLPTRGSPSRYDSYVLIIFAGMGFPAQRINRLVHTVDIASTMSLLAGVKPATGSFGVLLDEVFRKNQ